MEPTHSAESVRFSTELSDDACQVTSWSSTDGWEACSHPKFGIATGWADGQTFSVCFKHLMELAVKAPEVFVTPL